MFGKFGSSPAAPQPPSNAAPTPPPPAPPQAPLNEPKLWVSQNGGTPVVMSLSQAAAFPTAQAVPESSPNQAWAPVSSYIAAHAAASASRPSFGGAPAAPRPPAHNGAPAFGGGGGGNGIAPAGLFNGLAQASVTRHGQYIEPGDYLIKLCASQFKVGREKNMAIFEVEILGSTFHEGDPERGKCNKVGSRVSIFVNKNDSFAPNIKEIILAVSGVENGECRLETDVVTEEEGYAVVGLAMDGRTPITNPFIGAICYIEARDVTTRGGNPYTRTSWWPAPKLADGSPDFENATKYR